jgi:uncharacterized protein YbjT (DUF2867 family)
MILVTGATGTVGREVARQLAATNQAVRAFVRPGRGKDMRRRHCDLCQGDFDDLESLRTAMRNVDGVYLLSPTDPDLVQREANVIDVAKKAGVSRIVKHSSMGAGEVERVRFLRQHAESEHKIRESGIAWTFLRPTFFMSNLLGFASSIRREGRFYAPAGQATAAFIDPEDIAAAAVAAFTTPGHAGEVYELTGPEALTHAQVAERIGALLGRTVEYVPVPDDVARDAMVKQGMPEWVADGIVELYRAMREGGTGDVTDDFRRLVGRPPRSLDQFLREHLDAFREREERPSPNP